MGATSGAGTSDHYGAHEFTPVFNAGLYKKKFEYTNVAIRSRKSKKI
jgi:hypothetical protein